MSSFTMLSLCIPALVLSLSVGISHGYYHGGGGSHNDGISVCRFSNNPCRLRVDMTTGVGRQPITIGTQICRCSNPHNCSDDWNKFGHVVSREIVSRTQNMTLQMMFCKPVEPKGFCRPGNISLEVVGPQVMPLDISEYHCRCRSRMPLVLKRRVHGEDNMLYHSYACANHVASCARTQACMVYNETHVDYPCQCSRGFQCDVVSQDRRPLTESTYAYCNPTVIP